MNLTNSSPIQDSFTPISMGLYISVPVSAVAGSPTLSLRQPLINGHIFASTLVLLGAQIFLVLAQHIFKLESIPAFDLQTNQIIQMPMQEFHEFIKTITGNTSGLSSSATPANPSGALSSSAISPYAPGSRGFITPLPPEAPLLLSLVVNTSYSDNLYAPTNWLIVPIVAFPGLRGALPMILLSLLSTILIRAVVSPQTTGAKPLSKPGEQANSSLNFSPEDLLRFLSRFGKYFSSH
ncbi:hypothetical protein [Desulfitobacterium sp. AusDCA]|uniref:hypothetical protein n=1 Tax=Desulfitobacterium sp. AusDCA TaxID=3240383 RepID=UPI003DA79526